MQQKGGVQGRRALIARWRKLGEKPQIEEKKNTKAKMQM